jgi:hypothetical protein
MTSERHRVVLYNPRAVFYTMPLALLAVGSELDPKKYEVVIGDGRLDPDAEETVLSLLEGALCLGVRVLTRADGGRSASIASSKSRPPKRSRRLGRLASVDVRRGVPARGMRRYHSPGSRREAMLKRIKKDISIDEVFHTAERMRDLDIAGIFPFIVGFPDESDASVDATLACARKLRAMSSAFESPIFYFKPYPGSAIVAEAVARGFELPDSLADWSQFDFVAGLPGPWVTPQKYRLIERFKFFLDLASESGTRWGAWLRRLAELRCERKNFRWPIEMRVMQWLWPAEKLS